MVDRHNTTSVSFLIRKQFMDYMTGWAFSMHGCCENSYIIVGKREWKRPLGRPRHRWEDNIKMVLREIWLIDMD
jgi:hypothetical protein